MYRRSVLIAVCLIFLGLRASAQTNVTNSNNGTTNTVPVYTGSATLGNSPISVSGSSVGIGTTSPSTKMDVLGNVNLRAGYNTGTATIGSNNATGTLMEFSGIQMMPNSVSASGFGLVGGSNVASPIVWMYAYGGNNAFQVRSVGYNSTPATGSVLFYVDVAGKVGIGTTAPAYPLDVTGAIRTTTGVVFPDGTTQTTAFIATLCGGDYAESVDTSGDRKSFEPGDVLALDTAHPGDILNVCYAILHRSCWRVFDQAGNGWTKTAHPQERQGNPDGHGRDRSDEGEFRKRRNQGRRPACYFVDTRGCDEGHGPQSYVRCGAGQGNGIA